MSHHPSQARSRAAWMRLGAALGATLGLLALPCPPQAEAAGTAAPAKTAAPAETAAPAGRRMFSDGTSLQGTIVGQHFVVDLEPA